MIEPHYDNAAQEPPPPADLFDATPELQTIRAWARARYAAPQAVLGAVLLRVAASVGPEVQLPGLIGGRASLNLLAAFVSPSGGGKGISDKVARLAWPRPILEKPIGSGEGIAATFVPPKKPDPDHEPVRAAIFSAGEIDTLAGLAGRQGSILLAQLKNMAMGELLGQSNASEATTRIVPAHTYRACLSVGAQPGHCDVIFGDTTGGTPQRFLWFNTVDPDMPAEKTPDPEPLNTALPVWQPDWDGVVEIGYGPDEIAETVIAAHLARQRGQADALDGHALLTRCKVAAVLAIMHHRSVVSELDWQLSAEVMAMSDATRDWVLEQAAQARRAKIRERAIGRAVFDETIDERHSTTVRGRILRLLAAGPMSRGELRRAMGKQHYREAFDAVLPHLEKICQVKVIPGEKAPHYAINREFTGEPKFTPETRRSSGVNHEFTGEPATSVTNLDTRRSHESRPPKLSCQKWLDDHIAGLLEKGQTTAESFAVYGAGQAQGYSLDALRSAANRSKSVTVINRTDNGSTWDITGTNAPDYRPAHKWVSDYLDRLPADATTVDREHIRRAAEASGYSWTSVRHAALTHPRIESVPAEGDSTTKRLWLIRAATQDAAS